MEERKLEVIKFYIAKKGDKKEKFIMSSLENEDLIDKVFNEFIKYIDGYPTDENNKRVINMLIDENLKTFFRKKDNTRTISGIIETGKYGKEENVRDSSNKDKKTVFKIHKNHSVQKPFYFLMCIPKLKKDGLIILERDGPFGIKSTFTQILREFISIHFKDYKIHFSNFIDDQIVKNYINKGEYNTITLTRNSLPYDVAERYGLDKLESQDFVLELTLKTKGRRKILGNSKKQIQRIFEESYSGFFESEELKKVGFDDKSKIKVNSTYNGSKRTIDLSDTMKFKPYYDVQIEINNSGHSDFNSIEAEALGLLEDFDLNLYS